MAEVPLSHWFALLGCGCLWLGAQVVVVSGGPRRFQKAPPPLATKGTPQRFGQFWIDQYAWGGTTLSLVGLALIGYGATS